MGYSFCQGGHLCCDYCGDCACAGKGPVRRVRCPFGWCPPSAVCSVCRLVNHSEHFTRAHHRELGCEKFAREFAERQAERERMLAAGQLVRASALSVGPERVHVIFDGANGQSAGYFMRPETYHAIPILANATPEDYRRFGALEPAPSEFYGKGWLAATGRLEQ